MLIAMTGQKIKKGITYEKTISPPPKGRMPPNSLRSKTDFSNRKTGRSLIFGKVFMKCNLAVA